MLSVRVVMVSGFGPVLVTTTPKVKVPPGAGMVGGVALLSPGWPG